VTDAQAKVTLPIETADRGAPIVGGILASLGTVLGCLLVVACVADGLDKGFGRTWWMLILSLPFWWMAWNGLVAIRKREFCTVAADFVRVRTRRLRTWREWSEPTQKYRAVRIDSEALTVADGTNTGITSHVVTLVHDDPSKNIELPGADSLFRSDAADYCRAVAGLLRLPSEGCEE